MLAYKRKKTSGQVKWISVKVLISLVLVLLLLGAGFSVATAGQVQRIKDLANLEGTTTEPIVGYGLVVGLNGTGDGSSSEMTTNSISSMLEALDVSIDPSQLKAKNVAAVIVTGNLDPNANVGGRLDITVNSLNDASSLEGGQLIMTPLRSVDGTIAVMAQGSVSIGGFNINSGGGSSFRKNHPVVGIIPNGGIVKQRIPGSSFVRDNKVSWLLNFPDFSTAASVAKTINSNYGAGVARAMDAQRIEVAVPTNFQGEPVTFIAQMGQLSASSDAPARVVMNERTGTIIVGKKVRLTEAAVAHGTLKVVVNTSYDVSQPSSFSSRGNTVIVPDVSTDVQDREARVLRVPDTSTVADVVGVLNDIGASPRDIIAILQALKQAGSLQAELVLM